MESFSRGWQKPTLSLKGRNGPCHALNLKWPLKIPILNIYIPQYITFLGDLGRLRDGSYIVCGSRSLDSGLWKWLPHVWLYHPKHNQSCLKVIPSLWLWLLTSVSWSASEVNNLHHILPLPWAELTWNTFLSTMDWNTLNPQAKINLSFLP